MPAPRFAVVSGRGKPNPALPPASISYSTPLPTPMELAAQLANLDPREVFRLLGALAGGADINPGANMEQEESHEMPGPTREEMNLSIAAAEARTDTKIAKMEGKLDLVLSKLDDMRGDNRSIRANLWIGVCSLAVLIVAIAALFPVFFGLGAQIRDMVHMEMPKLPTK